MARAGFAALAVFVMGLAWVQVAPSAWFQHTGKLMSLARGQGYRLRTFGAHGLPLSAIPRQGREVVSPFYVVHYGLIYSKAWTPPKGHEQLWQDDDTLDAWNVPPPAALATDENARFAARWVLDHLERDAHGKAHLLYHFDWHYEGTTQGVLKAPWYSGLTDAYAILLMLRAHAVTGEAAYLGAAQDLYASVLTPMAEGGSRVDLPSGPWIEEYVASNNANPPLVFNGMFYATLGVLAFERDQPVASPWAPRLLASLKAEAPRYDLGWWTAYDRLGTLNNPKYHQVHVAIAKQLARMTGDAAYGELAKRWEGYHPHLFYLAFVKGRPTYTHWAILAQLLGLGALTGLGTWLWARRRVHP